MFNLTPKRLHPLKTTVQLNPCFALKSNFKVTCSQVTKGYFATTGFKDCFHEGKELSNVLIALQWS